MLNYMKSELYRISHGSMVYVFVGSLCVLGLGVNLMECAAGSSDPSYYYNTVWNSSSNLLSSLSWLFFAAAMFAGGLFSDDRKNGTFKNALVGGCSRTEQFVGKCLVGAGVGLAGMAAILVVYIGSAVALLKGPVLEPIVCLIEGIAAALPFIMACGVLGVAACVALPKSDDGLVDAWSLLCGLLIFLVPIILGLVGLAVASVAELASWLPVSFFMNEVVVKQGVIIESVWSTPAGLAKCLITGFASLALFAGIGLWRVRKIEL